jgi:hypothetical protein
MSTNCKHFSTVLGLICRNECQVYWHLSSRWDAHTIISWVREKVDNEHLIAQTPDSPCKAV